MSCSKEAPEGKKQVTFNVKGDWSMTTSEMKGGTKSGSMSANGTDMTDLWIFDYMGENLVNTIHQVPEDDDWGTPTLDLDYGSHNLYFVASRGINPTVNNTSKTILFTKVSDTFWKSLNLNVTPSSDGDRDIDLDRVVTKLKLTITDEIAEGTSTLNITPNVWYYGIDYTTGAPTNSASSQAISVSVPSNYIGQTGQYATVFSFSAIAEWHTDVLFQAKTSGGDVLGEVTLNNVPFKRNRATNFEGPLYGSSGTGTITVNDTWEPDTNYVW